MAKIDTLHALVEPIVTSLDASIYDLEHEHGVVRVTIDRPGGVDLETVAEATRQISRQLDLDDPIPTNYTLEVTSPGLERNLRTAAHWASAIGDVVRVKLRPGVDGDRRFDGTVTSVGTDHVTVAVDGSERRIAIDEVDRARTVFVWGPQPKPGQPKGDRAPSGQTKSGRPIEAMSVPTDTSNESEN